MIGTTIPLSQNADVSVGPTSRVGKIAWAWASVFSIGVLGIVIAIMSGPLLEPFEELVEKPPYIVVLYRRWKYRKRAKLSAARVTPVDMTETHI